MPRPAPAAAFSRSTISACPNRRQLCGAAGSIRRICPVAWSRSTYSSIMTITRPERSSRRAATSRARETYVVHGLRPLGQPSRKERPAPAAAIRSAISAARAPPTASGPSNTVGSTRMHHSALNRYQVSHRTITGLTGLVNDQGVAPWLSSPEQIRLEPVSVRAVRHDPGQDGAAVGQVGELLADQNGRPRRDPQQFSEL